MKKLFKTIVILFIVFAAIIFAVNGYVKYTGGKKIIDVKDASSADCILVLGCGVRPDGTPSDMLYDRIKRGVELYKAGVAPKLLMSGDHGRKDYDEVNVMKKYAMNMGVPEEDIFMDHAGFSTYDSLYRARDIFRCRKITLISQKYHLYRGLYIAESLGIDAHGVAADYHIYAGQRGRDVREFLARVKDFFSCIIKPQPKFLGEAIPVNGDGRITNG